MAELQEKMLCLISLVYLTGLVAGGSIDTIDFDGDLYEGDDRSIFSSGGTYYIALNTTYVIYAAIIAGKTEILCFSCLIHFPRKRHFETSKILMLMFLN